MYVVFIIRIRNAKNKIQMVPSLKLFLLYDGTKAIGARKSQIWNHIQKKLYFIF